MTVFPLISDRNTRHRWYIAPSIMRIRKNLLRKEREYMNGT